MADDDGFISLPPGFVDADSGTHRRPRPERTERIPSDEIVFVPVVPGAPPVPTPAPVIEEAQPAENTAAEVDSVDDDETRIVPPRRVTPSWRLTIPGIDAPVVVEGALFLGRNPASTDEFPQAELLVVPDPSKSISKTHALLELDGGLWVHDLDSTNGVWVVSPGESPSEVTPGTRAPVTPGSDLELGDVIIQVEFS